MKLSKCLLLGAIIGSIFNFSSAELITAESNSFTFPPITPVQTKKYSKQVGYFKVTSSVCGGNINFSWFVPENSTKEKEGIIIIYSLLGKVVKKIPIYKNKGIVEWNQKNEIYRNGMYIVNFKYENFNRNLKLMLWK
ncbi:MAG: T9SS type A sorting domain-containing protein [Chitinispirillaceae bacterium]|nr:T9SS type A sorting domain-containing protein [Chitinispirillaceae bacterium]